MKKHLLVLFCIASFAANAQFAHNNISLLSNFDDPGVLAESVYGIRYQGCWGWKDPDDGREYAIIGSTFGTYFIEVTDPLNLVERDYVPGRETYCIWREYKTYGKYCYMVSDDTPNNSFQIADLSYLPDSVHIVHDDTTIFERSHTIYVDGQNLYCGSVSSYSGNASMAVYSLANPAAPLLKRRLNQDFPSINSVHDMFVVNDTIYASCGYQGLRIYRYDEGQNKFFQLGTLPGLNSDYNHSSFISKDHTTLYVCIEVPDDRPIQVVNVSNPSAPAVVNTFQTNDGATPHNPYVIDDMLVIAGYQDGVYTYDISSPQNPVLSGYFDTHPQNVGGYDNPPYAGCWGAYTDLPSGILIASDMQYGLFVLDKSLATGIAKNDLGSMDFTVYPNPAKGTITLEIGDNISESVDVLVTSLDGKVVFENSFEPSAMKTYRIDTKDYSAGLYMVKATAGSQTVTRRISVIR
jgi:choice-of-anchor B domain-containing protein